MKDKIRQLNDELRADFTKGKVVVTQGVMRFGTKRATQVIGLVRRFDMFTKDNDPHHEHDFGSVEAFGEIFFWKIDYYDRALMFGSSDPSDPMVTIRVLTIMHSSEY